MQPTMSHQMMGYDRTSAMFSPDGRLLQVEYAKKTVKQGVTVMSIVCKDGVVIVADKRIIDRLVVEKSVEKIFQVDSHIGAAASGIVSDGRILIERSQLVAQQHKVTYGEPIPISILVKDICDLKQQYTQLGGARPFGVSIIYAGIDENEPKLFVTEPTGIFFGFRATAIGEAESEIKEILLKEYKDTLSVEEGLKFCLKTLKKVLAKEFDITKIDAAYIKVADPQFKRITNNELKKYT